MTLKACAGVLMAAVLGCAVQTALAADAPAPPPLAEPIERFEDASNIVGRALPKGVELPVLQSVFRPWTIADNKVRGVTVGTRHESFPGMYEHILLQKGKVVAVRLFILDINRIKQLTPELEHLYISDFAEEVLDDFEPSRKLKTPVPDVFSVETKDMDKYDPRQWSYSAENKLVYTLCWAPAAYAQLWIETPQFHTARLAEEARKDDAHPISY